MSDSGGILSSVSLDRRRLLEARMSAPLPAGGGNSEPGFGSLPPKGTSNGSTALRENGLLVKATAPPPASDEEVEDSVGSFSSASNDSITTEKGGVRSAEQGKGDSRKRKRGKNTKLEQFFKRQESQKLSGKDLTIENLRRENEELKRQLEDSVVAAKVASEEAQSLAGRWRKALYECLRSAETHARAEREREFELKCERLGRIGVRRTGTTLQEGWEDGREAREVESSLAQIKLEKEEIERQQKELNKQLRKSTAEGSMPPPPSRGKGKFVQTTAYLLEQTEALRIRLSVLRKEESELMEKKDALESQKALLIREMRRLRDEKASPFNNMPVLHDRYQLTKLLGRGGFSEVYKAYDLQGLEWVALKVHQLHVYWSEEKKNNYIRHATREYEIHKALDHPRVVKLMDVFEIDKNSFCTVLEYCRGSDLDEYLKIHKVLSERESRNVISQVFSGLSYLNQQENKIIHYDLKPGNILLSDGQVKITDFGLSKVMGDNDDTALGMELTSQGAGTYWYLPPECFEVGPAPPRISSKVDVWSAGVILYQMLYGRKPFGHEQSQERIMRESTILRESLEFPLKPSVPADAKAFIKRCLTRDQRDRPNINQILEDPYLRKAQASSRSVGNNQSSS
mmetsp:Transcript_9386/g.40721  ORF Transcript_9386/g.40721 Transcript_9386/m.40721 type:complete len:628 (-) Transcript_9386:1236-3119(-)|eukprot:CAMPEP_0113960260 /NCGR_PEP_ID=MMETSP0011_2-20120614/4612_1 /TAXON_ID=101924 /ORGANISM="Rhodosorus marinus" /LENGTH=627 /DNA_ID=CAMNT_0000971685 /DNA_START=27 /DNA_END=1910 /DNA_ORIENTATION=+ /assembly_acc=CAM_ASM_000156